MSRTAAVPTLLLLVGCYRPVTEVMIVVPSDIVLDISTQATFLVSAGDAAPPPSSGLGGQLQKLPLTVSVSTDGESTSFSTIIGISQSPHQGQPLTIRRQVLGVRFQAHERRMLIVPLLSKCGCPALGCTPAQTGECADLQDPPLIPFDPMLANDNEGLLRLGGVRVPTDAGANAD